MNGNYTVISTFAGLHWQEKRYLTINELKIICSFPEDFKMIGNFKNQWARLGNSVMPKQMYHIARTLKEKILNEILT